VPELQRIMVWRLILISRSSALAALHTEMHDEEAWAFHAWAPNHQSCESSATEAEGPR